MAKASTHRFSRARPNSAGPIFDIYVMLPILACVYGAIVSPLWISIDAGPLIGDYWTPAQSQIMMAPRLEHKIFWPALTAISVILVTQGWNKLSLPPHIVCLLALLAFAGASVVWSFKPELSFMRFTQQAMVVISIVLPPLLAARTADLMLGVFLCFALALVLNFFFVLNQSPMILDYRVCYYGYFAFKGQLGECAGIALLLSLYQLTYAGWRRMLAIFVIGLAIYLVIMSDSKGSLALALPAPFLAGLALFIRKKTRISTAIVLLAIPLSYATLSSIVGNLVNRISWYLYGNYNLSGRTDIWDFANYEITRHPLFGWGYQSFWLSGPDSPSVVDAPGWIKNMPTAHNGYLDAMIDMGYVGLVLLLIFLFATLHAIGRVGDREPARAWILLTLTLYVISKNFIETVLMHGVDMLWLIFLIAAADAGRCWQPSPSGASEPIRRGPVVAERRPRFSRARNSNRLRRL